jgi:hypothetical protein
MTASKDWFSAQELAALNLPGLASTKRGVQMIIAREGWTKVRPRAGRGGGVEYHVSQLPEAARSRLQDRDARKGGKERLDRESVWNRWERLPERLRQEAQRRLEVIDRIEAMVAAGMRLTAAIDTVVAEATREARAAGGKRPFGASTIHEWRRRIAGVRPDDRAAYLAPDYVGRTTRTEIPVVAWEAYKALWLRQEKPTHAACYRYLERLAAEQGWSELPSRKTFERRILAEVPRDSEVLLRQGPKAAKHTVAHADRDKSALHALDVANLDGHTWDVFCLYEDGVVDRPVSLAVQDIYSGLPLAIRFDRTLSHHIVRLALADTFRDFGLVKRLIMDNGRENQAKEISGQTSRFRKRAAEEEPAGILKLLNIEPVFATPYHGQAKPIERMFRDWAGDIAKHPAFAGAYVGNKPTAKPENYKSKAIPIAEFEAIVRSEMAHYARQLGRRGRGMNGRSFLQVFEESVTAHPPRRVTPEQLRLCLLSAKVGAPDVRSGAIAIDDHRYWSAELAGLRRQRLVVRFDPQDLGQTVHVYDLQGRYLCSAERTLVGSYNSRADAQRIVRARAKATKRLKDASAELVRLQLEALPKPADAAPIAPPPADAPNVVRAEFGAPRTPEQLGQKAGARTNHNANWRRGLAASLGGG